jgi:nitrogen fixation protein FixH
LGSLIGTQLLVLRGVLHDPSFAVEEDYYQKAVDWDAHQEQARLNAELGWSLAVRLEPGEAGARVQVALASADGAPLDGATVVVEAFHNARASNVSRAELREVEPALYRGSIPARRPGLWELRLSARRSGQLYTEVVRRELDLPGGGR